MAVYAKKPFITPGEYLERERMAEGRSEYWNGVIVPMAGSTAEHNRISGDIYSQLGNRLDGTHFEPFTGNMSIHIPAFNRYVYPDASVSCEPEFEEADDIDVLVNPIVVFEVLSKSTAVADLTTKKDGYRSLPSLAAYVVVSPDAPRIEVFSRRADGSWQNDVIVGLEATLLLPVIGCELALADIYRRVEFPAEEEEPSQVSGSQ